MQDDLRSCLRSFEAHDQLLTIEREVDPKFELPAVMSAAEKRGSAVLFNRVKGSELRVVNNVFGSRDMLALLFETTPNSLAAEWLKRISNPVEPEIVSTGPVKEVIKTGSDVDLRELPIVTHCAKDAGPYITAGIVIAKDPETGIRNVSVNRMQYQGRSALGIGLMPPQHLGIIYEKCAKKGDSLEIAVAVGNHPFEILAGATTVDYGVDEFTLSSALRREPLQLVKCETVDLEVPATAEIVLEGEVRLGVTEPEGPFGDFLQHYIPVGDRHVVEVKAITRRADAIYQTIQASSLEDVHLLALSREGQVYEAVSKMADVQAVCMVPTILSCMISIRKRFEGEAKNVMAAAFGAYSWLKYCVVVDHDVDVFDMNDVWWAVSTRNSPQSGLLLMENALGFPGDPFNLHQSKLGIDATAPLDQWEQFERKVVPGAEDIRLEDYL
jgi:2,5-furandicarboxylate decarboxylase 1